MKVVIVDTYYEAFLRSIYVESSKIKNASYQTQREILFKQCFGTSNFYSRNLNNLGHNCEELIVNCPQLQKAWAKESGIKANFFSLNVPHRFHKLPLIGPRLASLPGMMDIAINQIIEAKPDVLYCQDLSYFTPKALEELRPYAKLIVGQIACPLPPVAFLKNYDLILTSFPHFVSKLKNVDIQSEYFRIGFESSIVEALGNLSKDIPVSFVGGISRHHLKAVPLLEYLAVHTPIQFFGYGSDVLQNSSPILRRHHGEVWGLDMYRTLSRSQITVNRHINVAENFANNMRLFEATGVGSLLITDKKDNLGDFFEVDREVLAYESPEEAAELINYYLANPAEAEVIAKAGQARTLKDHTYQTRMSELVSILARYIK